jgi:TrmH family RNA methyltransferase
LFLEGIRLIEEALAAGAHFETLAFTAELETSKRGRTLLNGFKRISCRGALITNQVMEAIAGTEAPQGVAALVSRPVYELGDAFAGGPQLIVVADQLQDPGNLGTIVRTAEAAGGTGFITTRYTVDPFNKKALRASMGAALRIPLVTDARAADIGALCRERQIKIIATRTEMPPARTVLEDAARKDTVQIHTEVDLTQPVALVLGREASGVPDETAAIADCFIHIPMAKGVESLNVAAAAAILLYEAARQRNFLFNR